MVNIISAIQSMGEYVPQDDEDGIHHFCPARWDEEVSEISSSHHAGQKLLTEESPKQHFFISIIFFPSFPFWTGGSSSRQNPRPRPLLTVDHGREQWSKDKPRTFSATIS